MAEENKTLQLIEQIVKAVTLIYAFLVFCGALYFHFYYNTFNINIFGYLDISEISVSFLHIIIPTIVFLGGIIFYSSIVLLAMTIFPKGTKERIYSEKSKVVIRSIQYVWVIFSIICCAAYLLYARQKISISMHFDDNRSYYWITFLVLSTSISVLKYELKFIIINAIIIFVIASVYTAISDVKETLDSSQVKKYTIITSGNDTIKTNSKYFFVGRTNKYIFLYDPTNKVNDEIPVNEVKKLSYK